jgi:hypothetical protein
LPEPVACWILLSLTKTVPIKEVILGKDDALHVGGMTTTLRRRSVIVSIC